MTSGPEPARRDHDVIGVGIGPFNLGLAALLAPVDDVDAVFFDAKPQFSWHAGLLLDGTTLQVPFMADLVTLADPTSSYSFLNYLHCRQRLYRFYFYERFHVPRREYDAYCRWVADQLPSCQFGRRVVAVRPTDDDRWSVLVARSPGADGSHPTVGAAADRTGTTNGADGSQRQVGAAEENGSETTNRAGAHAGAHADGTDAVEVEEHRADAVVFGIGSRPVVPASARDHLGDSVFHSASYLPNRERALAAGSATVIGSGQSAAEVFADLLAHGPGRAPDGRLDWFTRSRGFLPMEYSKLGLEHFTPEYTAYFHGLPEDRRDALRAGQDLLYKGISSETSAQIFDMLYEAGIDGTDPDVGYRSACELRELRALWPDQPSHRPHQPSPGWRLTFHHLDEDTSFTHHSDVVVLATGYEPAPLPLAPAGDELVERDDHGRPVVELDYRVRLAGRPKSTLFVQNAELHTHGVGAPDLGLGAHRNAVLVNALTGREVYPVRQRNVFQSFGALNSQMPEGRLSQGPVPSGHMSEETAR